jgi:hypothetical protein
MGTTTDKVWMAACGFGSLTLMDGVIGDIFD